MLHQTLPTNTHLVTLQYGAVSPLTSKYMPYNKHVKRLSSVTYYAVFTRNYILSSHVVWSSGVIDTLYTYMYMIVHVHCMGNNIKQGDADKIAHVLT